MILSNSVELWLMNHTNKKYLTGIDIHPDIDRDRLLEYLLKEYGSLTTLAHTSEEFHSEVDNFFAIHKWTFDRLVATMSLQYNPIENYNKTIDNREDEDKTGRIVDDTTSTSKVNNDGTSNYNNTNFVSAFNQIPSNTPPYNDSESTRNVSGSATTSKIDSSSDSNKTTSTTDTRDKTEHTLEKGLVGDKTYQRLIEEERKQAMFNIYKRIGNIFADELLLGVW